MSHSNGPYLNEKGASIQIIEKKIHVLFKALGGKPSLSTLNYISFQIMLLEKQLKDLQFEDEEDDSLNQCGERIRELEILTLQKRGNKPMNVQEYDSLALQTKILSKKFKVLYEQSLTQELIIERDESCSSSPIGKSSLLSGFSMSPFSFTPGSASSGSLENSMSPLKENPSNSNLFFARSKAFLNALQLLREYEELASLIQIIYHRNEKLKLDYSPNFVKKITDLYQIVQFESGKNFNFMLNIWRIQNSISSDTPILLPRGKCVLCGVDQRSYCMNCEKRMVTSKQLTTLLLYGLNLQLEKNLNTSPAVEKLLSPTILYMRNDSYMKTKRENTMELRKARDQITIKIAENKKHLAELQKRKEKQLEQIEIRKKAMLPLNLDYVSELNDSIFNVTQDISKIDDKLNIIKKEKLIELKELINIVPTYGIDLNKFQYIEKFNVPLTTDFFESSSEVGAAVLGEVVLFIHSICKFFEISDLPYPITFIGSYSILFNPLTNRQTILNRDSCKDIEDFRSALKNLNFNILHVSLCCGLEVSKQILFEHDSKLGSKYLISNLYNFFREKIKLLEKKIDLYDKPNIPRSPNANVSSNNNNNNNNNNGRGNNTNNDISSKNYKNNIFIHHNITPHSTTSPSSPLSSSSRSIPLTLSYSSNHSTDGSNDFIEYTPEIPTRFVYKPDLLPLPSPTRKRNFPNTSPTKSSTSDSISTSDKSTKDNDDEFEGFVLIEGEEWKDSARKDISHFIPNK